MRRVPRRKTARWMAQTPQAIMNTMTTGRLKSTRKVPSCQALACQASLTLATLIASASDNRGYCNHRRNLGHAQTCSSTDFSIAAFQAAPCLPSDQHRTEVPIRAGAARCTISINLRGSERSAQHLCVAPHCLLSLDRANLSLGPFHPLPELFPGHGSDEFLRSVKGALWHRFVTASRYRPNRALPRKRSLVECLDMIYNFPATFG